MQFWVKQSSGLSLFCGPNNCFILTVIAFSNIGNTLLKLGMYIKIVVTFEKYSDDIWRIIRRFMAIQDWEGRF
jgi:hypothetical protein